MKIEYLSEVPFDAKRKYTKWIQCLTEFWKSDLPVMKITMDPEKDVKIQSACGNIRRSVSTCGYRIEVHYHGNVIIVKKLKD